MIDLLIVVGSAFAILLVAFLVFWLFAQIPPASVRQQRKRCAVGDHVWHPFTGGGSYCVYCMATQEPTENTTWKVEARGDA